MRWKQVYIWQSWISWKEIIIKPWAITSTWAIPKLPSVGIMPQCFKASPHGNLLYENEFDLHERKCEGTHIFIFMISHEDSFWNRGKRQLRKLANWFAPDTTHFYSTGSFPRLWRETKLYLFHQWLWLSPTQGYCLCSLCCKPDTVMSD